MHFSKTQKSNLIFVLIFSLFLFIHPINIPASNSITYNEGLLSITIKEMSILEILQEMQKILPDSIKLEINGKFFYLKFDMNLVR